MSIRRWHSCLRNLDSFWLLLQHLQSTYYCVTGHRVCLIMQNLLHHQFILPLRNSAGDAKPGKFPNINTKCLKGLLQVYLSYIAVLHLYTSLDIYAVFQVFWRHMASANIIILVQVTIRCQSITLFKAIVAIQKQWYRFCNASLWKMQIRCI